MRIDVLTIFPEFFAEVFDFGIIRRAKLAGIVEINVHDIREFATDKHKMVDDRPFGGGDGMVLKPEPIFSAIESLLGTSDRDEYPDGTKVVLLSPQGQPLKQPVASSLADTTTHLVLICGRYEGVDERVNEKLVTEEISIGDYVFSGGEPAAVVLVDSIVRLLPNALGSEYIGGERFVLGWPARLPALHAAGRVSRDEGSRCFVERQSCRDRKMASRKGARKDKVKSKGSIKRRKW